MNQSELEANTCSKVTGVKRGKTRANKSQLVLVLHLIGWESGASNINQSQRSEAKPKQNANYFRQSTETPSIEKCAES